MLIISLATNETKDFLEYKQTLNKLNYEYKIIGMNQPWEGFKMKIDYYIKELNKLQLNEIVALCDSYDVLFLQGPKVLQDKYNQLAKGKVVIGLENQTDILCSFIPICDPKVLEKCNIKNKIYPDFKYINAGFIMGPVHLLLNIYNYMKKEEEEDDQSGLYKWISENCDHCYFDYNIDFVFNHMPVTLITKQVKTELKENKIKVRNNSYPVLVHMPAQYLDLGHRSEKYRNFVIGKNRIPTSGLEYFTQAYNKSCTPECFYIGYWWFFVLIFIIVIIIYYYKRK
jgi:hypothetical protein